MARKNPATKKGKQAKFAKVMREFKAGTLRSSSGRKVTSVRQAKAIAASESGTVKKKRKKK
jgi:hypothetical protein